MTGNGRVSRRLSLPVAFLAVALAAVGPALAQESPAVVTTGTPTVEVNGEATISRPPDVAYLTLAVESRARSPRDAQRQNAEAAAGVLKQVGDAAVPRSAVRTLGPWLEQEFDTANGRRTPRGFIARNTIEVRIDDVARAGEIADLVVQAGATSLMGIRFDLKDRPAVEREALRLAVADGRRRAESAAAGADRTVDRILRIADSPGDGVVPQRMFMRAEASGAQTAVEPGVIEVRARVVVTAAMK
jgi:uncharacterized protein YggE